jgi:GH25 family lysozyme M1 (1,4-beta-N-acetylmuramidase)
MRVEHKEKVPMTEATMMNEVASDIPAELDPQGLRRAGVEPYAQPVGELEEGQSPPSEWFPNEPLLIDVSKYQGQIDFVQLAQNPSPSKVEAVIARATLGTSWTDGTFRRNLDGAMEHIGVAGAYMVLHPGADARQQVDHFLRFTGGNYGNLPVSVDVELDHGQPKRVITDTLVEVLRYLRQATGKLPIIYTANWFWAPHVFHTPSLWELYKHRLWVAHYGNTPFAPTLPEPWRTWGGDGHLIHQYSSTGRLRGIPPATDVDLNRLNGNLTLLHKLAGIVHGGEVITDGGGNGTGPEDDVSIRSFEERIAALEARVQALEAHHTDD